MPGRITNNSRLISLIGLIGLALIIILYPYAVRSNGVIVTSIGEKSACKEIISVGSKITEIAGHAINNANDLEQVLRGLTGTITLTVDNNPRSCKIPENMTLDLTITNIKKTGFKVGVDLGGGMSYVFKAENASVSRVLDILKTRAKVYDLFNTKIDATDNNLINVISGAEEENSIKLITERGILEGKIKQTVSLKEEKGKFTFGDKTYDILIKNNKTISINKTDYLAGNEFYLNGLSVKIQSISGNSTVFEIKIFDENDLTLAEDVARTSTNRRIVKQDNYYIFAINTILSKVASGNFAKATKGQESVINPSTGESFLKNPLIISIDDRTITEIPITSAEAGKEKTELMIWGYRSNMEAATGDMLKLLSTINSKRLPVELTLVETKSVTNSDNSSIKMFIYVGVALSALSFILLFAKYRKKGVIVFPLILISVGEIVLILGAMSLEWFAVLLFLFCFGLAALNGEIRGWIGWITIILFLTLSVGIAMSKWIIDKYSLYGLIAFMVFSFSQSLYMTFGLLKNGTFAQTEYKNLVYKFWFVFGIAGLILTPLFFIGILKDFVMTFAIGIIVSTALTKPLYSNILEKITK
jgi:uncharacterized membrane protein YjjP (DUF1212 family)